LGWWEKIRGTSVSVWSLSKDKKQKCLLMINHRVALIASSSPDADNAHHVGCMGRSPASGGGGLSLPCAFNTLWLVTA
jgi:hypothetical protein